MVKGETYDKQLFESDAFRHFINIFLNKQSGVTKGCEITKDTQNITVAAGCFVIQGGLLKETTGTDNAIPTEAGYYKLVYEIDLSKTNNKDEFKQGSYKFVKAIGDYPKLTQEDLDEGGTIYQLPFCQFRITEEGIQDFADIRTKINYGIYEKREKTLWKNANDLQEFKVQTLKSDNYKGFKKLKIVFHNRITRSGARAIQVYSQEVYPLGYGHSEGTNLVYTDISADNIVRVWKREVTYNAETGEITFYNGDLNNNSQNNVIVPIEIIGCPE